MSDPWVLSNYEPGTKTMSDIVERLRGRIVFDDLHATVCEAADEIERLRAALREIAELPYSNVTGAYIAQMALAEGKD